jgi:aromatic amino acid aminotransferase I / 2-aminoadipate transaminase
MQLWLHMDHRLHPSFPQRSIQEIEDAVHKACVADGVLMAKGSWFRAEPKKPLTAIRFRATFAAATHENTFEAIRRLGSTVRTSFQL